MDKVKKLAYGIMIVVAIPTLGMMFLSNLNSFKIPFLGRQSAILTVDESAVAFFLRTAAVMEAEKYSEEENRTRLDKTVRAVSEKIYFRLARFNKARAQVNCEKKSKDIMLGVAEGLKDAGIISDELFQSEVDYIESTNKSSIFPNIVEYNFCELAK